MKRLTLVLVGCLLAVLVVWRGDMPRVTAGGVCDTVRPLTGWIEEGNAYPFSCYVFDVPANTDYLIIEVSPRAGLSLDLYHAEGQANSVSDGDMVNSGDIQAEVTYAFLQPVAGPHTVAVATTGASAGARGQFDLSAVAVPAASAASTQAAASCGDGCRVTYSLTNSGIRIGSNFGDRIIFPLEVGGPGAVAVSATWSGSAQNLAVILNGPGQVGYYARVDGRSPLTLRYTITSSDYARGYKWRVSLVNFGGGTATGNVTIDYPGTSVRVRVRAPAACGGDIRTGNPIKEAISAPGRDCRYKFTGSAGDRFTVRMTATGGQLDPWLDLLDSGGSRVASDDDGGGGRNSLITYTLPRSGAYTIVAGSYQGKSAGSFELSLAGSAGGACGGSIGAGQTLRGEIPGVGRDCRYTFNGSAGDRYAVRLTAAGTQLDPWLDLLDPSGSRVAFDDDGGDGRNSLITYTLERNGAYTIVAGSYGGRSAGTYDLSLRQPQPRQQAFSNPTVDGFRLDWCYVPGDGCGQRAATEWCKTVGFDRATDFQQDVDVGQRGIRTKVLSNGYICDGTYCDSFKSITCSR